MIYIVEDDNNIRELIIYTLENLGFKTCGFESPASFWKQLENQIPSLIILDVMLPQEDGISVLKKLRAKKETSKLPIMILTAKDSEYDKVVGLDSGADDYMSKPFGMMELIARIKALLRRVEPSDIKEYTAGSIYICPAKHVVTANGKEVMLTQKEFDLLCYLLKNKNIVLSRNDILEKVWGYTFDGGSRTVDVHIRTLRSKLGDAGNCIETIRGFGYKIGE